MFGAHGVGDRGEGGVARGGHAVDLWRLAALVDGGCVGVWVGT